MADVAAGMLGPFGQKHRLDAALEEFIIQLRRGSRWSHRVGNGHCGESDGEDERATRHSTLHMQGISSPIVLQMPASTSRDSVGAYDPIVWTMSGSMRLPSSAADP